MPSGSLRVSLRRKWTSDTTFPTTRTSIPCTARSPTSTRCSATRSGRNIHIILDFVMNHTSDQHKWFIDSRSSRTSKHRDWYIWRDGKGAEPAAQQLALDLWRIGLAVRRQDQPVLLPLLLSAAARSQLAQSRRARTRCSGSRAGGTTRASPDSDWTPSTRCSKIPTCTTIRCCRERTPSAIRR